MTEISSLSAFRLVVLRVIAHFVEDSLDETISLTELTSVVNKNPLIQLLRENLEELKNSISIRDVIIALMAIFQGSEIRILENKDQFKLRMTRLQFNNKINLIQNLYDKSMLESINLLELKFNEELQLNLKNKNKQVIILANNLLDSISSLKYSSIFDKPVDDNVAPNYHKLIKFPTDLKSIRAKVKDGRINSKKQLQKELLLMYSNAIMYNKSNNEIYNWSGEMIKETERLWQLLE